MSPFDTTALDADHEASVLDLELTMRAYNCLRRHGIHTIGQLVTHTEVDLLGIRSFGTGSLDDVIDKLAARGLTLAGGPR